MVILSGFCDSQSRCISIEQWPQTRRDLSIEFHPLYLSKWSTAKQFPGVSECSTNSKIWARPISASSVKCRQLARQSWKSTRERTMSNSFWIITLGKYREPIQRSWLKFCTTVKFRSRAECYGESVRTGFSITFCLWFYFDCTTCGTISRHNFTL